METKSFKAKDISYILKEKYDGSTIINAVYNNKNIGYVSFVVKRGKAWLYKVFVNEVFRHLKIGTNLIKLFENYCVEHLVKDIEGKYYPEEKDEIVRKFYQDNGYSIDREYYDIYVSKNTLSKQKVDIELINDNHVEEIEKV